MVEFEPIVGRYLPVRFDGVDYRIFVEEAGSGVPLLCLHTAGLRTAHKIHHAMERARILHRKEAIALDHKFGNPHQHGEEVMIERRWCGAQEFAPNLDRSAESESRSRINPRVRHNIANAPLVDAQYVTRISET